MILIMNLNQQYPLKDYQIASSNMAAASVILGIISIITSCCVYTTLIMAPVGIILALLSRGENIKMTAQAKVGIVLCIISYAVLIILIAYTFLTLIAQHGSFDNVINYYTNQIKAI